MGDCHMGIHIATLESAHFTFTAAAPSEAEAVANLIAGLQRHGRQYRCPTGWYEEDDISITYVEAGGATRDGHPI